VNLGDDLSMTNNQYFSASLKPTINFMSWCAILPFIACTLLIWFPVTSLELDVLNILRLYSVVIVSFVAGSVWSAALLIQLGKETLVFNRKNLMLGAGFVAVLSWLVLFIDAKAGVFISALLFLVLWQIELKTNLARIYPEWFWTLRTKQTMVIALCLMGVWMTLG
jgi:hypothetical protein